MLAYQNQDIKILENSFLAIPIEMAENTTIYIFGGDSFPEERIIYWNFVASNKELIENAKEKWLAQKFEKVPGETEFVPLPEQNKPYR